MAKLLLYSVFDSKVQLFAEPFFMRTRGEALRGWQEVANDKNTNICRYAEDFSLMEIGSFDESTGTFENLPSGPQNMGLAAQFKRVDMPVQTELMDQIAKQRIADSHRNAELARAAGQS